MNYYDLAKISPTKKYYFVRKPCGYGKKIAETKKGKTTMAIYNFGDDKQKKVSRQTMMKTIMRANDWTRDQYRKQYDLFKNKLRFFENVQASRGVKDYMEGGDRYKQSPQEVLYKIAKAKLLYGKDYEPSQDVRQIMAVTAHSITKGKKIAEAASSKSYKAAVSAIVNIRFAGFSDFYKKAKEIVDSISDPVKQEEALTAFATYLHSRFPRVGKDKDAPKKGEGGFAYGETFGSGDEELGNEFDISQWID